VEKLPTPAYRPRGSWVERRANIESVGSGGETTTEVVESGTVWEGERRPPHDSLPSSGGRIGRYRLERVLGRGGMGVVHAAHDPELGRAVALKVMRVEQVGSSPVAEAQARMIREAQALAGLAHPNVVTVYDVGRMDDRVYIAMELVEGRTLRRWIAAGPHPWVRVAEVMLEAGRGLVAAHAQGIVHRDFKPANVLIGTDGRVRVADFGLARSGPALESSHEGRSVGLEPDSAESFSSRLPVLTEAGMVMGTPGYMAPEQTAGESLDARSDQFSYCVTFYEALYGQRPHEGKNRRELLRNARLGRIRRSKRGPVPTALRRAILRGLAPDPDARWRTLEDLLAKVERIVERRRGARWWWMAGGVTLALATGAIVASEAATDPCAAIAEEIHVVWNAEHRARIAFVVAEREGEDAAQTWERIADRLDVHVDEWVEAREDACRNREADGTIRDAMVACLARRRAELEALVEVLGAADRETLRGAVMAVTKLSPSVECSSERDPAAGLPPPPARIAGEVQALHEQLASLSVYRDTRRFERALEVGRAVLDAAGALGHAPLHAEALFRHGRTLAEHAEYETAAQHMQEGFYLAVECGHDEIAAEAASSLYFLHAYRRGDPETGSRWLGQAEAITDRMGTAGSHARWRLAQDRGAVAIRDGEYELASELLTEALELARAHYGADNLQTAGVLGNLGVAQLNRGDLDAARRSFESAIEISERLVGPDHPRRASWLNNLGVIEQNQGRHEMSLEYFVQAYDLEAEVLGDAHPSIGMSLNNIGGALAYLGRNVEAKAYFERSIAVYDAASGFDPLDRARPIGNLGRTHSFLGDHARGIPRLLEAIQIIEDEMGREHPELGPHCLNLGTAYLRIGEHEAALAQMQRAHDIDLAVLGPEHPFVASTLASMAEVHLQLGRRDQAVELIERALEIQERAGGDAVNLAATRFGLARALWPDRRQRARANELLDLAEEAFEAAGPAGADRLTELRAWIARR
jgi:eukaryotic-like serine/threonine-protein kinase